MKFKAGDLVQLNCIKEYGIVIKKRQNFYGHYCDIIFSKFDNLVKGEIHVDNMSLVHRIKEKNDT